MKECMQNIVCNDMWYCRILQPNNLGLYLGGEVDTNVLNWLGGTEAFSHLTHFSMFGISANICSLRPTHSLPTFGFSASQPSYYSNKLIQELSIPIFSLQKRGKRFRGKHVRNARQVECSFCLAYFTFFGITSRKKWFSFSNSHPLC